MGFVFCGSKFCGWLKVKEEDFMKVSLTDGRRIVFNPRANLRLETSYLAEAEGEGRLF